MLARGGVQYDFSHDRLRDAAYAQISPVRRAQYHRRIAIALTRLYADDLDALATELAVHYEQAGLIEEAVLWHERAAAHQRRVHALSSSIGHLRRGLALLGSGKESPEETKQALHMYVDLGQDLTASNVASAQELRSIWQHVRQLAQQAGDPYRRFRATRSLSIHYYSRGEFDRVPELVQDMVEIAEEVEEPELMALARWTEVRLLALRGRFVQARMQLEQIMADFPPLDSLDQADLNLRAVRINPRLNRFACLPNLGQILWLLGYPNQARAWIEKARREVEQDRRLPEFWVSTVFALRFYRIMDEQDEMQILSEQLLVLGAQRERNEDTHIALLFQGWVLFCQGQSAAGIERMEKSIAFFRILNQSMHQMYGLAMVAEAHLCAGNLAAAADHLRDALSISEQTQGRWWDAELHRLRGDLHLASGASDSEVEACYQRAIDIAQQQQAKWLELRAVMSLCRFWQQQGKPAEARARLATIYNWFTEGVWHSGPTGGQSAARPASFRTSGSVMG